MSRRAKRRREVAVHEAGHAVVARALGATYVSARLSRSGRGGSYRAKIAGSTVNDAVIALAGRQATERALGVRYGDAQDRRDALRALRGTGVSMRDARRQATRLVERHGAEIEAVAGELARRGRFGGRRR